MCITGLDAVKKVPGHQRGLIVDVIGLIIAAMVTIASVHDYAIGTGLLDAIAGAGCGRVSKVLVDRGFKSSVVEHGQKLGINVQIVQLNAVSNEFVPKGIWWVIGQTNGLSMLERFAHAS